MNDIFLVNCTLNMLRKACLPPLILFNKSSALNFHVGYHWSFNLLVQQQIWYGTYYVRNTKFTTDKFCTRKAGGCTTNHKSVHAYSIYSPLAPHFCLLFHLCICKFLIFASIICMWVQFLWFLLWFKIITRRRMSEIYRVTDILVENWCTCINCF